MMRFSISISLLLLLAIILSPDVSAQKGRPGLKGLVMDAAGLGVANVELTINEKHIIKTDRYGSFQFMGVSPYLEVTSLKAEKLGYKLDSWRVLRRGGSLEIQVVKTGIFSGQVTNSQGNPVAKVGVKLESPKKFGPVYTDEKGFFSMKLPKGVEINAFSSFSINGEMIEKGAIRLAADNSTVDIDYNPPQTASVGSSTPDGKAKEQAPTSSRVVEKVVEHVNQTIVLIGTDGKPMRNMSLQVNGKPAKTNYKGEIELPASQVSKFRIVANGFEIEPTSSLDKNGNLKFVAKGNRLSNAGPVVSGSQELIDTLAKRAKSDGTIEVVSKEFQEIFDGLQKKRTTLATEANSLSSKFREVVQKLLNDKTLTESERDRLIGRLLRLEQELNARYNAIEEEQKKTEEIFSNMKIKIETQDSLNSLTTTKLRLVESEKKQAELKQEKNRNTFLAIAAALLAIALVSIFFMRRTKQQKKQVELANTELKKTKNQLEDTVAEVNDLNTSIIQQNQKITSSIRYAQTIQDAVLPTVAMMTSYFEDYFIIFEPKDIVSGDFYWAGYIPDEEKYFVIAVDCTGHGVPGGFMSMIGHSLLNDIIYKNKIYSPAQILEELNGGIRDALKQEQKVNEDGMDVACCLLEPQGDGTTNLTFSGAMRPLYIGYSDKEKLEIIKGDHKSAGGLQLKPNRRFTNKERVLRSGDSLYLTSDGYGDQHNKDKKKLGTRGLIGLIEDRLMMDMTTQGQSLKSYLHTYKEGVEQRDDIMIIGVKV